MSNKLSLYYFIIILVEFREFENFIYMYKLLAFS